MKSSYGFDCNQEPTFRYLVGSKDFDDSFSRTCSHAQTMLGYSKTLHVQVVIQLRCKRWGCRICGERKMTSYAWKVSDAEPNRLVTLTVANKIWESPRAAYHGTKRKVTELAVKLRRRYDEFEYFKVLETTRKGWPHYHLIVRSDYIPHQVLKELWSTLTGATIVDVRAIKKAKDVFFYVVKYLGKQHYVPWTYRRTSWSKKFFPPSSFDPPPSLQIKDARWTDSHPKDVIERWCEGLDVVPYSPDCWMIPEGQMDDLGVPMGRRRKSPK